VAAAQPPPEGAPPATAPISVFQRRHALQGRVDEHVACQRGRREERGEEVEEHRDVEHASQAQGHAVGEAARGLTRPAGWRGPAVRRIRASASRSSTWIRTLAPADYETVPAMMCVSPSGPSRPLLP